MQILKGVNAPIFLMVDCKGSFVEDHQGLHMEV